MRSVCLYIYIHTCAASYACTILKNCRLSWQETTTKKDGKKVFDVATDEDIEVAKKNDVKLNRKSKIWIVGLAGHERTFAFGSKLLTKPCESLTDALKEKGRLTAFEKEVATWTTKQCNEYLTSHGLSLKKHLRLQLRRDAVASHKWWGKASAAKSSESVPAPEGPQEGPPQKKQRTEAAQDNGKNSKDGKALIMGLPRPFVSEAAPLEDVTSSLYQRSAEKNAEIEFAAHSGCVREGKDHASKVLLPSISIGKFIEAVNLMKDHEATVYGDLAGIKLNKGKNKGMWLIQSLFVPDMDADDSKNETEHQAWLDLHTSLSVVGRRWSFCCAVGICCYISIYLYIYVCIFGLKILIHACCSIKVDICHLCVLVPPGVVIGRTVY